MIEHIGDLTPDAANRRKHNPRNIGMIAESLQTVGAARSIVIDEAGNVLAGNGTIEAAAQAGIERVRVVEADGNEIIAVQRRGLSEEQKRKLALYDNRTAELAEWDTGQIAADLEAGLSFDGIFSDKELAGFLEKAADELLAEEAAEEETLEPWDVPDARFPTDNAWDVPTLDIRMQATALELPFEKWGAKGRALKQRGTVHFYTDDYKFEALWKDPTPVVNSGCRVAVEPNYTVSLQSPRAYVLWNAYRKRWLARFWQDCGVKVFVDLNVPAEYADLTFLGVPSEWRAYITRGYKDRFEATLNEHQAACEHHGSEDLLFVVYGGGKTVKEECNARGWVWLPEEADVKRGRVDG